MVVTIFQRILRGVGWTLAGLLGVVFLVGYVAPYVSPSQFWWVDLFAVLVPVTGLGVGILGLALCTWGGYRRKWGRVAVGGLLLGLLVIRFGPRLAAWGPSAHEGETFRLMTFNVPPSLGGRRAPGAMEELLQRQAPDVLAFQESRLQTVGERTGRFHRVSASIQALLDSSTGYALPRALPPETTVQQPVMARGMVLDSMSVHLLPPAGETDARSRYTRTQFTWKGRSGVLYNVHLHSVGKERPWTLLPEEWTSLSRWSTFLRTYREGALRRAQQARLLRRQIARETEPVLLVGDFNSTPHQWAYRHLAQGLQSAVNRRVRGWGATFPARYPLVQIDHVLADPAWQITAARIPTFEATEELSDHRPVIAHLRWKVD